MYDVIIRDGTIVRSSGRLVADIAIQDGKIAYVGGNPGGPAKEEISAIGRFVMPGSLTPTSTSVIQATRPRRAGRLAPRKRCGVG